MGIRYYDRRGRLKADTGGIRGPGPSPHYGVWFNLVPPKKSHFTLQSGGTLVQSAWGLVLTAPASASTPNLRIVDRAVPTGDWVITAYLWPHLFAEGAFHHCGILLRESSTGRLHSISFWDDSTLTISRWTSPTVFSANDMAATAMPGMVKHPLPLSIARQNGAYVFRQWDGLGNQTLMSSITLGDWLTADRIGFYVNAGTANIDAFMTVLSWEKQIVN